MLKTNSKQVVENVWKHICEHYDDVANDSNLTVEETLINDLHCVNGDTYYHRALRLVDGGLFDVYTVDMRASLQHILEETPEEADGYDDDEVYNLYRHLLARIIDKRVSRFLKQKMEIDTSER